MRLQMAKAFFDIFSYKPRQRRLAKAQFSGLNAHKQVI